MEKIFEDAFMDLQSEYVSLCLELLGNTVEKIYIYLSIEDKSQMFNVFVQKSNTIQTLNQVVNDRALLMQFLKLGTSDIEKIKSLCKQYNVSTPTELKMTYNVITGKFNAVYQYKPVCTDVSSGEIFMKWVSLEKERLSTNK